jgi:hypothetical protein
VRYKTYSQTSVATSVLITLNEREDIGQQPQGRFIEPSILCPQGVLIYTYIVNEESVVYFCLKL